MNAFFEKFSAFIFLLLLVGMVAFMAFFVVPEENRDVVLMIVGALTVTSTSALPKLFGTNDNEKELLKERVRKLETEYAILKAAYDELTRKLVAHHVIADGSGLIGNPPNQQLENKG